MAWGNESRQDINIITLQLREVTGKWKDEGFKKHEGVARRV
jgi:hypothetical protein